MNKFNIDTTYLGTLPSSNYGVRKDGSIIDSIIIHDTVTATLQQALDIFQKPDSQVSTHYLIDISASGKGGTCIYQLLDDKARAFHAGVSYWGGKRDLNQTSIGIELVNVGDQPFPSLQIDSLVELIKFIMSNNPAITPRNIISHADVGPGRKYDPNCMFKWETINDTLEIYPEVFDTSGTNKVIIGYTVSAPANVIRRAQMSLVKIGYHNLKISNVYDVDTGKVFHAFNQHFAPETFARETMDDKEQMVIKPENNQWYDNSQVRLNSLLKIINATTTLTTDNFYLYAATDNGSTWIRGLGPGTVWVNIGSLASFSINALTTDKFYLYAAVADGSTWIRPLGTGKKWEKIGTLGTAANALVADKSYLYAAADDGSTWMRRLGLAPGEGWINIGSPTIAPINALVTDNQYLYAAATNGSTWIRGLGPGAEWRNIGSLSPSSINTLTLDSKYLYAGGADGSIWIRWLGTDTVWVNIGFPTTFSINTLATTSQHLYAAAADGSIWMRPLGAGTGKWVVIDSPTSRFINALVADNQYLYMAESSGSVWMRPFGTGKEWIKI